MPRDSTAPLIVQYERWWTVYSSGREQRSEECATLEQACHVATNMLVSGSYSVTIYKTERPHESVESAV